MLWRRQRRSILTSRQHLVNAAGALLAEELRFAACDSARLVSVRIR